MDDLICFTQLNDYIFCPVSIYFHNLFGEMARELYQKSDQINGTKAHETIDNQRYSSKKSILQAIDVMSVEYGLVGKIDIYDVSSKTLIERKRKIKTIYDGYIFQLYAQYFSMIESGYDVRYLKLHSIEDNKTYSVKLPNEDTEKYEKFKNLIAEMKSVDITKYIQTNKEKCKHCIYEPACDRGLV